MNIIIVTSETNPQIKEMAAMLTARGRRGSDRFLVEGFHAVAEAVRAGLRITRIAAQNEVIEADRMRALFKTGGLDDALVLKVPRELIKKMCMAETPQGVVAEVKRPAPAPDADAFAEPGMVVACEGIQDPRNLGLLLRTAHAAGVRHVFLAPGSVDYLHPHTVAASAGSVFHLAVHADTELPDLIKKARKRGAVVWATAASGATPLPEAIRDAPERMLLLFGNEGAGISPDTAKRADALISIPMPGAAESLNIAVAAAVILFSVVMKMDAGS